jgi:16S rRNA (guanine966-N2)-methyltransferase
MSPPFQARSLPHQLRIVGGQWRGRKLLLPADTSIRPTPDRVRETLFNWLQHDIVGTRCLDLFAGSGALGIEALSRGARQAVFVDSDPKVVRYLRATLQRLQTTAGTAHLSDALQWLEAGSNSAEQFDLVFLDPPFAAGVLPAVCRSLEQNNWLQTQALIYIECPARDGSPDLPGWPLIKSKTAGQVGYHLACRHAQ